jgi:hypothetical protein
MSDALREEAGVWKKTERYSEEAPAWGCADVENALQTPGGRAGSDEGVAVMPYGKGPASPVTGGGRRGNRFVARGGRGFARLALWACAILAILAGTALAQPPARPPVPGPDQVQPMVQPLPQEARPGPPPAHAADPRQGERWLASYRGCIERNVAGLAALGGDVRQVAETAYGACQHMASLAGVPAGRREALEQAAWSYALQAALRRMEEQGAGGLAP